QSDLGTITKGAYAHAVQQTLVRASLKKLPKPGTVEYQQVQTSALGDILDSIWIRGEAVAQNVSITKRQVVQKLNSIKTSQFHAPGQFSLFMKQNHFTEADVLLRVELGLLSQQIQAKVQNVPPPSASRISDYYNAAIAQYTQPELRDVRLVL